VDAYDVKVPPLGQQPSILDFIRSIYAETLRRLGLFLGTLANTLLRNVRMVDDEIPIDEAGSVTPGLSALDLDCPEIVRQHERAVEYHSCGQHEEAERVYKSIVMRKKASHGEHHSATLSSQANHARLMFTFGTLRQHQEGILMAVEVLNRRRNTLGPDNPDTLSSQHDVAMIYTMLGCYEDAARLYKDTVERRTKVVGPNHPDTLASQRDLEMVLATCERLPRVKIVSFNA